MNAYSMDLRHKIVEALSTGTPKARGARASGVGLSTVKRYAGGAQRGESLTSRKPPGKRRKVYGITQRLLERDLEECPTATLPQRRELLARVAGVELSDCTVSRALRRMGFGRKKDCEYCDHGARDVSPRWSDPKKKRASCLSSDPSTGSAGVAAPPVGGVARDLIEARRERSLRSLVRRLRAGA